MRKSYKITFNTQDELDKFIIDNFVDVDEVGFELKVGNTYKVVDHKKKGFWIEEV